MRQIGVQLAEEVILVDATIGAFLAIGVCAVGLMGLPLTLAEYRSKKVFKRLQVTLVHPVMLLSVQLIAQSAMRVVSALLNAAAMGAPFTEMVLSATVLAVIAVVGVVVSVRAFRWDMG